VKVREEGPFRISLLESSLQVCPSGQLAQLLAIVGHQPNDPNQISVHIVL